jgi:hypothetical protein
MSELCAPGIGKPGGVYMCTDPDFKGYCKWVEPADAWKNCHDFTRPTGIWRSIQPTYQGYCVFYAGLKCTSGKVLRINIGATLVE